MTQDKSASRSGQGTQTPGSTQGTSGLGPSNNPTEQAKQAARQAADQAKDKVGEVTDQAKEKVGSQLATQKDRVAENIGGVAQMLRQTGQQMRDQDQHGLTDYVDRAASQVERLSSYLRDNDMGRVVDDVERFARREPALFLGGAFVLGLLGARFMKSSRPAPRYNERYDDRFYGSSGAYEYRPYYSGYDAQTSYSPSSNPASTGRGAGTTGSSGSSSSTTGSSGSSGGTLASRAQAAAGNTPQRGAGVYDKDREGS